MLGSMYRTRATFLSGMGCHVLHLVVGRKEDRGHLDSWGLQFSKLDGIQTEIDRKV
jgi:hypothetical protein